MPPRRPAEGQPAGQPPAKKVPDIAAIRAQIAAKKAAVEARLAGSASGSASPAPRGGSPGPAPGPASLPPKPSMDSDTADRIAAAKARIEALKSKRDAAASAPRPPEKPANPYLPAEPKPKPRPAPAISGVALHPMLMPDADVGLVQEKNEKKAMRDRYRTMAPKFSTVRANAAAVEEAAKAAEKAAPARAQAVSNPYTAAPAEEGPVGPMKDGGEPRPARRSRKMQFSAPGKYVKQGDELRNEIKLEELKQRIAAQSRKAGLDSEFDVLERSLKRQVPPAVEWWDAAILPPGDEGYDDLEKAEEWISTSKDSLVTHLVQHPIPIVAPSDKHMPERGLMLTKKEQRKMRRQRRLADLEDKRDRQKMGLIPPDPPKVRLANLMKVLTSDAVQDPTKVEARVRREVEMRRLRHEKDNDERKLTKEERAEKEYTKMAERERNNGLFVNAYLIRYLTNGRHKFKVRETAKHDLLSGLCIFHPNFALVLVEGVEKKIKHYNQLMLRRIDWTEESRPQGEGSDAESDAEKDKPPAQVGADGEAPDMSTNKCELIWSGEIPERSFRIFRARHAETDSAGKEFLTQKYEGIWDLAKRWTWDDDDL